MTDITVPQIFIGYSYSQGGEIQGYDISQIVESCNMVSGKNQPFAYAEIKARKYFFNDSADGSKNDTGYWSQFSAPYNTKPTIVDGQTTIFVQCYGQTYNMIIEKQASSDDYITLSCYNLAYKLKTTKISAIADIKFVSGTYSFTYDSTKVLEDVTSQYTVQSGRAVVRYTINSIYSVNFVVLAGTGILDVEQVFGSPAALFAFMATIVAGYDATALHIDAGYFYDYTIGNTYSSIQTTYTSQEVSTAKTTRLANNPDTYTCRLRTDYYCWDQILALGSFSNRSAFFSDFAYFVGYTGMTNTGEYTYATDMAVDYGSAVYHLPGDENDYALDVLQIADNEDQGSTYVIASQKASSENYATSISISDVTTSVEGQDLYYAYPGSDTGTLSSIEDRNFQTMMIAFNRIVNYYHPNDCISFSLSEIATSPISQTFPSSSYVYTSYDTLLAAQGMTAGDIARVDEYYVTSYFVYTTQWEGLDNPAFRNVTFKPYSCIGQVNDIQNAIALNNAPLACTQISWPQCVTILWFGDVSFQDSQQQLSNLVQGSQTVYTNSTPDTKISDKYSAKIVVGNQALSELDDERTDFTGLILEKNWDVDLYRLVGYNGGVIEAMFNTEGKIEAGAGTVKMDSGGLTVYSGVGNTEVVASIDTSGTYNTGYISGTPYVYLNKNGLSILTNSSFNTASAINFTTAREGGTLKGNIYASTSEMTLRSYGGANLVLRNGNGGGSGNSYTTYMASYCTSGGSVSPGNTNIYAGSPASLLNSGGSCTTKFSGGSWQVIVGAGIRSALPSSNVTNMQISLTITPTVTSTGSASFTVYSSSTTIIATSSTYVWTSNASKDIIAQIAPGTSVHHIVISLSSWDSTVTTSNLRVTYNTASTTSGSTITLGTNSVSVSGDLTTTGDLTSNGTIYSSYGNITNLTVTNLTGGGFGTILAADTFTTTGGAGASGSYVTFKASGGSSFAIICGRTFVDGTGNANVYFPFAFASYPCITLTPVSTDTEKNMVALVNNNAASLLTFFGMTLRDTESTALRSSDVYWMAMGPI